MIFPHVYMQSLLSSSIAGVGSVKTSKGWVGHVLSEHSWKNKTQCLNVLSLQNLDFKEVGWFLFSALTTTLGKKK